MTEEERRELAHKRRNEIQDIIHTTLLRMADLDEAFSQWLHACEMWRELGSKDCEGQYFETFLEAGWPLASILHKGSRGKVPGLGVGLSLNRWMEGYDDEPR
jgi:hypothetical protein